MSKRTAWALIVASLAFGFVLGWVIAGGRQRVDRPSPGQMSQQMAPGMANAPGRGSTSPGMSELPPDHPPIDKDWTRDPEWQKELQTQLNRVQQDPQDWQAWRVLARLYTVAQQVDKAQEAYGRVTAIRPDDPDVYAEVGLFYLNSNRFEEAERMADRALQLAPDHADALFLKGSVLGMYHRDRAAATQVWERLLQKHPQYPMADFVRQMLQQIKQPAGQTPSS
ncbi:MAG: tetratricopeptide repeat protein [Acidobacteria bacterium]|nr:tetratricopeptide repeat protein [Acidobacteriota bacterium]MDW7984539.1 tetratricopeptide repeat protein [Acidobacteriota bacterium]